MVQNVAFSIITVVMENPLLQYIAEMGLGGVIVWVETTLA
jgi:hypothetical protein